MSKHFSTIVVCVIAIMQSMLSAQTPYDSFHPETSRPMLRLERDTAWRQQIEDDNGSFLIVANHNSGIVMLYDLCGDSLVAVADINPDMLLWLSVDPLADKNIAESPYVYCGGNPTNRIDFNGMDWYSTTDDNGVTCFYYNDQIHSADDMKKMNIHGKYEGTNFERNGTYYSLFGKTMSSKTYSGQLYQAVDNALIQYANYQRESMLFTSSSPFETDDPLPPRYNFDIPSVEIGKRVSFQYEGGAGIYSKSKNNRATNTIFPNTDKPPINYGGYLGQNKLSYPLVFSNKYGWETIIIKFYDRESAQHFINNYNNQFFKK